MTGEGQNLSRTHETLLIDELTGGVRRNPGPVEGPREWRALVLLHGDVSRGRSVG